MSDALPIHRHPVADVHRDLGLSRSAFYRRLSQAGVKPIRVGQHSFLDATQRRALEELEQFIQAGGDPDHFPGKLSSEESAMVPSSPALPATTQTQLPLEEPEDLEAPEELVAAAVTHLDGLLSFLTKAARLGWELPTSQVQLLLGAKPRGASMERYGFTFRAAGKHGQETSWRVEQGHPPNPQP
jgi:hypothetical protein